MNNEANRAPQFLETDVTFEVSGLLMHDQHTFIYEFAVTVPEIEPKEGQIGAKMVLSKEMGLDGPSWRYCIPTKRSFDLLSSSPLRYHHLVEESFSRQGGTGDCCLRGSLLPLFQNKSPML